MNEHVVPVLARYLRYRDLCILSQTCRGMNKILARNDIWEEQYQKTWWSEFAKDYPEESPDQHFKDRLRNRILHIKKVLNNEPVMTLLLYRQTHENGMIKGETRYHKVNLRRPESLLTGQIQNLNGIQRPFSVTVHLPDGRTETFFSTVPKRYAKPLYYQIGIEYAVHTFGEPKVKEQKGQRIVVREKIPYEARLSFKGLKGKYQNAAHRNRKEERKYHLERYRQWRREHS